MSRAVGAAATGWAGAGMEGAGAGNAMLGGSGAATAAPARLGQELLGEGAGAGAAATGAGVGGVARSPRAGGNNSCERGACAGAARTPLASGATGGVGSKAGAGAGVGIGVSVGGGAKASCGAGSGAGGRSVGAVIKRERGASAGAGLTAGAAAIAVIGGSRKVGVDDGGGTGGAAAIIGAGAGWAPPGSSRRDFGAAAGACATARGAGCAEGRAGLAMPRGGRSNKLAMLGAGPRLSSTESSIVTRLRAWASPPITIASTIAIARVDAIPASGRRDRAALRGAFGALSGAIGSVAGNRRTRMITLRFVEVATLSDPPVGDNAARKNSPL